MTQVPAITKWHTVLDRLAYIGVMIIILVVSISVALGLLAALLGSFLTEAGDGLGGGWGVPELALTLATLLGVPSLIISAMDILRGRWGQAGRMLAFWGPLIISIGFIVIGHAIDPCFRGIWTLGSHWGSIPLCEQFGIEVNIHTRFHLFLHAAPTLILVFLYWVALRKWHPSVAYFRSQVNP